MGDVVEIACDESGSEGANLIGGVTEVFAHGGVRLDHADAAACVAELRERIRSPAVEYKANHLLRGKHRGALVWLLGPDGPLHGRASVHLVQKEFFAVCRIVDLLCGVPFADTVGGIRDARTLAAARELYRDGRRALGSSAWAGLLGSFVTLLRPNGGPVPVESFVDPALAAAEKLPASSAALLRLAPKALPPALTELADDPLAALDPLLPAFARTVAHWGRTGGVSVLHDRQRALNPERIALLGAVLGDGTLHEVRFADSVRDPRVQVADFLVGVARWIAEVELTGRGEAELNALLRPYLDPLSLWGDDRSWTALTALSERDG